MAARYSIGILNSTGMDMALKEAHLDQGVWGDGGEAAPPDTIHNGVIRGFFSESEGSMPGGHAIYTTSAGEFRVDWFDGRAFLRYPQGYYDTIFEKSAYNDGAKVAFYKVQY